jgi:hypothetical protein
MVLKKMANLKIDSFAIGQRTHIKDAGIDGTVQAVLFNAEGVQYHVAYWLDGIRRIEWVFAHELSAIQQPSMIAVKK